MWIYKHTHSNTYVYMYIYIYIYLHTYWAALTLEQNCTCSRKWLFDPRQGASSCKKRRRISFQYFWTSLAGASLNPFYILGWIKNLFWTIKKSLQEAMCAPDGTVCSLGTIFTYFPAKLGCFVPDSNATLGGLSCSEVASSSAQIPGKTYALILAANV